MEEICRFFKSLDLKESFSVGLLDFHHILIHFENERDFHRV